MDEVWVCGGCRSINEQRADRCYHCRAPRALSSVDPASLIVAGAGRAPTLDPAARVGKYRDSGTLGTLAQAMILGAAILSIAGSVLGADVIGRVLGGETEAAESGLVATGLLHLAALAVAVLALVAWSGWLSRVVANAPAVGLGWPNVSPRSAFLENLIPILNVFRVPAILRDVMGRLEPAGGRGDGLIVAAWLGLVGGLVLPRVGGFAVGLAAGSEEELVRWSLVLGQLSIGLTVVGAIFLVAIVNWIETRMDARAGGAVAAVPDAPSGVGPA